MNREINNFNIRVYGLLINSNREVLLSTERRKDFRFTKFPGGGMNFGEGTKECLKREFIEELGIEIHVVEHYYTTDFFLPSVFFKQDQIFSVYYLVETKSNQAIKNGRRAEDTAEGDEHYFHWEKIKNLTEEDFTFPIDKKVISLLQKDTRFK